MRQATRTTKFPLDLSQQHTWLALDFLLERVLIWNYVYTI